MLIFEIHYEIRSLRPVRRQTPTIVDLHLFKIQHSALLYTIRTFLRLHPACSNLIKRCYNPNMDVAIGREK